MKDLNNKIDLHKYDNIDINLERKESIKNLFKNCQLNSQISIIV